MAAKNWNHYHRHPRTTQERRQSQDKFDLLIRAKRRNLPNAWDDITKHSEKCWKRRRKTHYWLDKTDWCWRTYNYLPEPGQYRTAEWFKARQIADTLDRLGCFYEWKYGELVWFGPDIVKD